MTSVAVLQSNYIPWKGYFDIINDVDLFVFYDDVQFTKNDWRNRNKIMTANGPAWISIPVGQKISRNICDVEISDSSWQRSHWDKLRGSYSKAPHFKTYQTFFEEFYLGKTWTSLSDLNHHLIKEISRMLDINVQFDDSRRFGLEGQAQERLLKLLEQVGATSYVSGPAGRNYIEVEQFSSRGIELIYKDYSGYPEYQQMHSPFSHAVSIVDLLFNCGPDSPQKIWGWRG